MTLLDHVAEEVSPIGLQVAGEVVDVGLVTEMDVLRIMMFETVSDTCIPEVPELMSQPQAGVKVEVTRTMFPSIEYVAPPFKLT